MVAWGNVPTCQPWPFQPWFSLSWNSCFRWCPSPETPASWISSCLGVSFSVKQIMTTIRSSYWGSWSQHNLSTLGGLSHAALSSCILLLSDGAVCTLLADDPVNLGDHPLDPSVLSDQLSPRRERARLLHWSLQCPPASSSTCPPRWRALRYSLRFPDLKGNVCSWQAKLSTTYRYSQWRIRRALNFSW